MKKSNMTLEEVKEKTRKVKLDFLHPLSGQINQAHVATLHRLPKELEVGVIAEVPEFQKQSKEHEGYVFMHLKNGICCFCLYKVFQNEFTIELNKPFDYNKGSLMSQLRDMTYFDEKQRLIIKYIDDKNKLKNLFNKELREEVVYGEMEY